VRIHGSPLKAGRRLQNRWGGHDVLCPRGLTISQCGRGCEGARARAEGAEKSRMRHRRHLQIGRRTGEDRERNGETGSGSVRGHAEKEGGGVLTGARGSR
jgi:hypothetical protein